MKDLRSNLPLFLVTVLQFLLKQTDLLAVWSGILAWDAITGKSLPVGAGWPLFFGSFAITSFRIWRKEALRARAAEDALAAERKKPHAVRVFVDLPEALLERYGQTGTLAEKRLTPSLDKWLRVSGSFEGAVDALVGDAIFMSLILENGRRIQLQFRGEERNRIRLLREGQQVTALCQVRHGHGAGVFVLENCELIWAEALRSRLARVS